MVHHTRVVVWVWSGGGLSFPQSNWHQLAMSCCYELCHNVDVSPDLLHLMHLLLGLGLQWCRLQMAATQQSRCCGICLMVNADHARHLAAVAGQPDAERYHARVHRQELFGMPISCSSSGMK